MSWELFGLVQTVGFYDNPFCGVAGKVVGLGFCGRVALVRVLQGPDRQILRTGRQSMLDVG